ncbi:MAG: BlaI/MecI/CopY family transcriptional regulator [Lachnospiraceae bacterium]|nr:BlaI/MecI/CopY family transcriptional regulator [Lachnospiraceae bacterium]
MSDYKLGEVETRFAELIWENEPLGSGELVKLCAEKLGWKKSTTYTVLKKLCEKGYFRNEDGTVTSLISREGMQAQESRRFVEDTFGGSLPAFLAAFTSERTLSDKDVEDIRRMIEAYGEASK